MKTIGLIGGMSWRSTLEYYRIINELVGERLGGYHSAKIILHSVDFDEILRFQGDWKRLGEMLAEIAKRLEFCGADLILICTNTMHKVADYVQEAIDVPLLNIIDVTAEEIKKAGLEVVGILGTKFTMEDEFYREGLRRYGIKALIPDEEDRKTVHRIIFEELCFGVFKESSKEKLKGIVERLRKDGAEGVVLACTELPLILSQEEFEIPLFDTTRIHAEYAVSFALKG
ncbi:MAG: aspartate racemase [Archaeoglobales archaeon]|nr:MAG: aspartate racemase [Archaeoglobales archaeon]